MDVAQLAIIIGLIANIALAGYGFGMLVQRVNNLNEKYEERTVLIKELLDKINNLCIRIVALEIKMNSLEIQLSNRNREKS